MSGSSFIVVSNSLFIEFDINKIELNKNIRRVKIKKIKIFFDPLLKIDNTEKSNKNLFILLCNFYP